MTDCTLSRVFMFMFYSFSFEQFAACTVIIYVQAEMYTELHTQLNLNDFYYNQFCQSHLFRDGRPNWI